MKMRKKGDLPTKPCLHCGRLFAWRKKWAKDWDEVKYCSDRCRGERKGVRQGEHHNDRDGNHQRQEAQA